MNFKGLRQPQIFPCTARNYRICSIKHLGVYFFGGLFTWRLLETGASSRQAFIFTCTNFTCARVPFDSHSVSAHGESWQRLLQKTSQDGEADAAGSHYTH